MVDKPGGWTSHDVVARVRRLARMKRVGHTGTLDPDATGVLLVCVGIATRLIEFTEGHHKAYRATLALGVETDSQDASGAVAATHDAAHVTEAGLRAILPRFTGNILQVPPMVSAVHHNGERLYDIARRGETVERAARPATIFHLNASDFAPGPLATATLDVECGGGTYIRTLCHDIGAALGVGGHMASLRRTRVGPFGVETAATLDALASSVEAGTLDAWLRPVEELLPENWPRITGTDEDAENVRHGRTIPATVEGEWTAFFTDGRLLAVLRREGAFWRPHKVLVGTP